MSKNIVLAICLFVFSVAVKSEPVKVKIDSLNTVKSTKEGTDTSKKAVKTVDAEKIYINQSQDKLGKVRAYIVTIENLAPKANIPENMKWPLIKMDTMLDETENSLLGISSSKDAEKTVNNIEKLWSYSVVFGLLGSSIISKNSEVDKTMKEMENTLNDLRLGIKYEYSGRKAVTEVSPSIMKNMGRIKASVIAIENLSSGAGLSGSVLTPISNLKNTCDEIEDALYGLSSDEDAQKTLKKVTNIWSVATTCELASSLLGEKYKTVNDGIKNVKETSDSVRIEIKKQYLSKNTSK